MNDSKREAIRKALERAGSLEALLEGIVRSESEEFRRHQREVEQGTDHPSHELLREYALGRVSQEEDARLTEHISLCGVCAHEVFKLQYTEKGKKDIVISWLAWLKNFVPELSFPASIHPLEAVRGATEDQERCYSPGTELVISMEAPADGYVTAFHGCEETDKVELAFPRETDDDPRVSAGLMIPPIAGPVEGPEGKHWIKIFWTRVLVMDPAAYRLMDAEERERASADFFYELAKLDPNNWRLAVIEYQVAELPSEENK